MKSYKFSQFKRKSGILIRLNDYEWILTLLNERFEQFFILLPLNKMNISKNNQFFVNFPLK